MWDDLGSFEGAGQIAGKFRSVHFPNWRAFLPLSSQTLPKNFYSLTQPLEMSRPLLNVLKIYFPSCQVEVASISLQQRRIDYASKYIVVPWCAKHSFGFFFSNRKSEIYPAFDYYL
jgi:hypothetical protein